MDTVISFISERDDLTGISRFAKAPFSPRQQQILKGIDAISQKINKNLENAGMKHESAQLAFEEEGRLDAAGDSPRSFQFGNMGDDLEKQGNQLQHLAADLMGQIDVLITAFLKNHKINCTFQYILFKINLLTSIKNGEQF